MNYSAADSECLIYTFKEGLLAKAAHDLKLRVNSFQIEIEGDKTVNARFDAGSIETLTAMKEGRENTFALSGKDTAQIKDNLARDVLDTASYPEVTFRSSEVSRTSANVVVKGDLTIRGRSKSITIEALAEDGGYEMTILLDQTDFGIKPFSALFGAIKIRPEIRVVLKLAAGSRSSEK